MHAGIFLAQHPEREEVYLTRRKGFVKLAIQGGAGRHFPSRSLWQDSKVAHLPHRTTGNLA